MELSISLRYHIIRKQMVKLNEQFKHSKTVREGENEDLQIKLSQFLLYDGTTCTMSTGLAPLEFFMKRRL